MIFFDAPSLFGFLLHIYDLSAELGRAEVDIATYGISLFDERNCWGRSHTKARDFLKRLEDNQNVRLLVGVPPLKKGPNGSYGLSQKDYYERVTQIEQLNGEFGIRCLPIEDFHLKMYRIGPVYVTGGINFGNSYWTDCSVTVDNGDDAHALQEVFEQSWLGASKIRPIYINRPIWLGQKGD